MTQLRALANYLRELGGDESDIDVLVNLTLAVTTNELEDISLASITAQPLSYKVTLNVLNEESHAIHKLTVIVRTDDELF